MIHAHDAIRNHLLTQLGYPHAGLGQIQQLDELQQSEWSAEFERLMRNRLIIGRFRYGPLVGNKTKYDTAEAAIVRIRLYQQTGNREYLADAANCCQLTFVRDAHPTGHFYASDDHDHHVPPIA